jgi:molybdenum cofactor cytidylyltransferase
VPDTGRPGGGVRALVLAAGSSERFGGGKLLAPFQGRPLIAHVAATLAQAIGMGHLGGGVAVIPPGDTGLAWQFDTAGLTPVVNPDAATGIASSLRRGLAALEAGPGEVGAALVVLADQPLLRTEVIAALVTEWRRSGTSVRPRYGDDPGAPGHPVLVARADWPLAAQLTGDEGLGRLFRTGAAPIREISVSGRNPDVDTPADLRRLEDHPA